MDKITHYPCNGLGHDSEKRTTSQSKVNDAKRDGSFIIPPTKLAESPFRDEARGSLGCERQQHKPATFSPKKKSVQMLKYRVRNQHGEFEDETEGEDKENETSGQADSTWNANQSDEDLDLEDSGFEFGFEKEPDSLTTRLSDNIGIEHHKPTEAKGHESILIETEALETVVIKTQNHESKTQDHEIEAEGHISPIESEDDETIKAKAEYEASDTDSFQRAASVTSSCIDSLENASIVSAKEVMITSHTAKEVSLEERSLIQPYDDDMTAPLIPKSKQFETTVYGREGTHRVFQFFRRQSQPATELGLNKENNPKNENDAAIRVPRVGRRRPRPPPPGVERLDYDTYPGLVSRPEGKKDQGSHTPVSPPEFKKDAVQTLLSPPKAAKEQATALEPSTSASTLNRTKVTILPSPSFYPPSPDGPAPPPPPKDTNKTYQGRQTPGQRSETPNRRPTPSPTPSKKYKELNLRPPIPIVPLQQTMHLYASTGHLPLPKHNHNSVNSNTLEAKEKDSLAGLPNFSRRRTLFGNHLAVPNPNENHLRRATYNSPSTHSVRLPIPQSLGMQLPQRPGTSCGTNRPDSSATAQNSKRERFKNFFRKL
ncbi:hypothetical protein TWF970_006753 [Orbilia oligospora]|uniref:Uncharacterized protein n=1 Tax=Orbilia oligospora TaxID=2813651 RepID=A0A7C8R913_ORBOL|nr:hypothetical protein TWF970_006753 [Orbilia oligospora]